MAYITINTPQDILNCIQSIDDTFAFKNKVEMNTELNKLGFFENVLHNMADIYGNYFWFDGFINELPVSIRISNKYDDNECRLMEKYFFKMVNDEKVSHRDNNLPAFVWNDTWTDIGNVRLIHYWLDGERTQHDRLAPSRISFHENIIYHHYTLPKYEDRPTDSITIDHISCENNTVIDIQAFYGYTNLSLKQLISIIPRIEQFSFEQFTNLKNELTAEENTLLHMLSI